MATMEIQTHGKTMVQKLTRRKRMVRPKSIPTKAMIKISMPTERVMLTVRTKLNPTTGNM
jgi:hypothetical protein